MLQPPPTLPFRPRPGMAIGDLVISGDGNRGEDGKDGKGYNAHASSRGVRGLHGENGTDPSNGQNAQIVHVSLQRAREPHFESSGIVLSVAVDKHDLELPCSLILPHSEIQDTFPHELPPDANITITSCGGAGGRGGWGGNGQGGGHGTDGLNATDKVSGTNGGPGGDGGNAGDGTSGANGGSGGIIKLVVKEQDLDLLVAMERPRVDGGQGGKAGVNGNPGHGGNGGRGGSAYTARQTTKMEGGGTQEIAFHNIGGQAGPAGKTGAPSIAAPTDGFDGTNGEIQIYIEKPDATTAGPYASPYNLEVVEFEIVDSNEDGILEFGEEVTLRNIGVRNSGGMPSPKASAVTIEAVPTEWLIAPRTKHEIPSGILKGATIRLDGRFTYKLKRPKREPTEQPFSLQDTILLRAHMAGIDRILRDFHTPRNVILEYPIEMTPPNYLRCLAAGQQARFTWKISNKSKKDLGVSTLSNRRVECKVTQAGTGSVLLGTSNATSWELSLPVLPANTSKDIELLVKVPANAPPYTRTKLQISLYLTSADKTETSAIQSFVLPIQLSNTFRHDPNADVLLVTNFETDAHEVDSWYRLITNKFGMKLDIWNVSVNGHLELLGGSRLAERQSIFELYKGKTIVILGNSYPYFSRGSRTTLNLIDPKDFVKAATEGTRVFLAGTDAKPEHVARFLRASSYPLSREFNTIHALVDAALVERQEKSFSNTIFSCLPKPRGDNTQRCTVKARRAANELRRKLPNERFIVSWTSAERLDRAGNVAGKIEVMPCTPFASKVVLTRTVPEPRAEEMNEWGILLSLPFKTKLEILWNEFGDDIAAVKRGAPQSFADVVAYDMANELARLVHDSPPWPDCIEKATVFQHLPRLDEFFKHDPGQPFSLGSVNRVVEILGDIRLLADCIPGSFPRQLTVQTRRKNIWAEVNDRIDTFLTFHYGHLGGKTGVKDAQRLLLKYVNEEIAKTLADTPARRKESLLRRISGKLGVIVGDDFADGKTGIVDLELVGNIVINQTEAAEWKQMDWGGKTQLEGDLAVAKDTIGEDMTKLPGYGS